MIEKAPSKNTSATDPPAESVNSKESLDGFMLTQDEIGDMTQAEVVVMVETNLERLEEEVVFMRKELIRKENILNRKVTQANEPQVVTVEEDADLAWVLSFTFIGVCFVMIGLIICLCI